MSAEHSHGTYKGIWNMICQLAYWPGILAGITLVALATWMLWLRNGEPATLTKLSLGGSALLYGLPGGDLFGFMPLADLAQGLMDSTLGCLPRLLIPLLTISLALAGAMAAERPSRLLTLAVCVISILCLPHAALVSTYNTEQFLYGATLLLFTLTLSHEDSSAASRWKTGAAFALCACVRSSILPFIPLLLLWRLLFMGGWRAPRLFLRDQALPLCLPTALLLCLWCGVAFAATGQFVPPEESRATSNVISGAMGFVGTIEGNFRQIAGLANGENPYAWALGYILADPLNYLRAIPYRALVAFNIAPWTFSIAITGMILFRAAPFYRAAGLVALYFLGAHCAMSVEARYFWALLPLGSAAALAAIFRLGGMLPPFSDKDPFTGKIAGHVIRMAELILYSLMTIALAFGVAYPLRAGKWNGRPHTSYFPQGGYFHAFWGTKALSAGDYSGAAESYKRAAKLLPLREYEKEFIWSSVLAGRHRLLSGRTMEILGRDTPKGALVMVAAAARAKDKASCKSAMRLWAKNSLTESWFFRGNGLGDFNKSERTVMNLTQAVFTSSASEGLLMLSSTLSEDERTFLVAAIKEDKIPLPQEMERISRITTNYYLGKASSSTNPKDKIAAMSRAVAADDKDKFVLIQAGAMAFDLHEYAKAEKWLLAAYGLDCMDRDAALSLINFYMLTDKPDKASPYCKRAKETGLIDDRELGKSCRAL